MKNENLKKRYLVILADRKKTRFFTIFLGNFEDKGEEVISKDVPQKVKAEGFRPGHISRHIQDHLQKHLKNMGKEVMGFLIRKKIKQLDGIYIGTHKELFGLVKEGLPKKIKNKVLGEFVVEPNAAIGDITKKVISKFNL